MHFLSLFSWKSDFLKAISSTPVWQRLRGQNHGIPADVDFDRQNEYYRVRRPSFVNGGKQILFENSSFNIDSFGSGV